MNRLPFAIITLVCITLFNSVVHACTCNEYHTPLCAKYGRADAVFIGQLETIKPSANNSDAMNQYNELHFVVEESYKGVKSKHVIVGASVGTTCSLSFETGTRYLVFASLDKDTSQLFTGMCRGTSSANSLSPEVVDYLRKASRQESPLSISGRITQNYYMDASGLTVQLISGNKQLTTTTDKSGAYSFSPPGPGEYKVLILVPYSVGFLHFHGKLDSREDRSSSLSTFEYSVVLTKNECHYLELGIHETGPK